MKLASINLWLLVAFLLQTSCQSDDDGDYSDSSEPGDDPDDSTPGDRITCSAESATHDACVESSCPISFDTIVSCKVPGVITSSAIQGGLRVGPDVAGEGVHFYAGGWFPSVGLFGTVSGETEVEISTYGEGMSDRPFFLMNPDGAPLLALAGRPPGPDWVLSVLSPTTTNEPETIVAGDRDLWIHGAALDPAGLVHVWTEVDLELSHFEGTLGEPFTEEAATFPGTAGAIFGLDAAGEEMAFGVVDSPSPDLVRRTSAGDEVISTLPYAPFRWVGRVVPQTTAGASGDYLAIFSYWTTDVAPGRLVHSVREGVATTFELELPETVFEETCTGGDAECPAQCDEVGEGQTGAGVELVQSADGRVWAAWVWGYTDRTVPYSVRCADDVGCDCRPSAPTRDDGNGELVLARVDLDEERFDEVLRLPLGKVAHTVSKYDEHRQGLHMSVFGEDLAVGINTYVTPTGDYDEGRLRLLRIDTSLIP